VSREPLVAVIDDDDPFRTALVESVCSLGYVARGFASAEEFVAAEMERACVCIITDIHMPGMSGFDLQRLLIARKARVPVIMITAHAESELEAKAVASGAVCLLRKPVEPDALIGWLEKTINV
jgi:FixJ family two-component response regulator